MNNKALIIFSIVFGSLIVLAAGGRFAWSYFANRVAEDPQTHYLEAVQVMEAGDVMQLTILVDRHPHLATTRRDADGTTLLHHAMLNGGSALYTQLLIERGADVNATDDAGQTPLHALCTTTDPSIKINADVVTLLLDAGADINAVDDAGNTPLKCMALVRDNYSEAFPEIFENITRTNRNILINHGAVE